MTADIGKPRMDIGNARRICLGFGFFKQARAFRIGGKHNVDQAVLGAGRFLRDLADPGALRDLDRAGFRGQIAGDQLEQRRLARAVAPHKSGLGTGGEGDAGLVDEEPSGDPVS